MRTALSIAGTDPSGGAGIQADLKTMTMNGVYAMSAITALVAQNTTGVQKIVAVAPEFLGQQIDVVFEDSYMFRVAYEEGEAEILAAILSCAYSYEVIAKTILDHNPFAAEHPFYGDWIQGYAAPHYSEANLLLLDTLDRLTVGYDEKQLQHLTNIFVACSRYELAFWEMAWRMSP